MFFTRYTQAGIIREFTENESVNWDCRRRVNCCLWSWNRNACVV